MNWVQSYLAAHPELQGLPVVKRSTRAIHFQRPDGQIEAHITPDRIHYLDDLGQWQEIDTRLQYDPVTDDYGAPFSALRLATDGTIKYLTRPIHDRPELGFYDPLSGAWWSLAVFGAFTVEDDHLTSTVNGYTLILRLTAAGIRSELTLPALPPGLSSGDVLAIRLHVPDDLPNGPAGSLPFGPYAVALPHAWDVNHRPVSTSRHARKFGTDQYILDGIPASALIGAQYPLALDPDYTADTSDGYVYTGSGSPDYATQHRYATGAAVTYADTPLYLELGQSYDTSLGGYLTWRAYLKFDTTTIPAIATITGAYISDGIYLDYSDTDFDIQIVQADWSAYEPVDSAVKAGGVFDLILDAPLDCVFRNTLGIITGPNNGPPYDGPQLDYGYIKKGAWTYYGYRSDRDAAGIIPTGLERVYPNGANSATANYRPILHVVYSVPTTTVQRSWAFDASSEGFTPAVTGAATASYDPAASHSASSGSLRSANSGRKVLGSSTWTWSGTWQDLGVPAGATVMQVRLQALWNQAPVLDTPSAVVAGKVELLDSAGALQATLHAGQPITAVTGWTNAGQQPDQNVPVGLQPAATRIQIRVTNQLDLGNSGAAAANVYNDELGLAISYAGGGPQIFNYLLAAALGASGTVRKQAQPASLSGALACAGTVLKQAAKALAGTLDAQAGLATTRALVLILLAALGLTGVVDRHAAYALATTLSFSGALSRSTWRGLLGSLDPAGALMRARQLLRAVGAALSFAGAQGRAIAHGEAGGLVAAGGLARQAGKGLRGALIPVGALTRRIVRALAGTLRLDGVLTRIKSFVQPMAGVIGPGGQLARSPAKSLAGTLAASAGLVRQAGKALEGTLAMGASLARMAQRALVGAVGFAVDLVRVKALVRAVGAQLALAGDLARAGRHNLAATLDLAATLSRRSARSFGGTLIPAGAALAALGTQAFQKALDATLALAGSLARSTHRALNGTLIPTGHLVTLRAIIRALAAALAPHSTLWRETRLGLAGVLAPTAGRVRQVRRSLAAALGSAGDLAQVRVMIHVLAAALSFAGTTTGRALKALLAGLAFSTARQRAVTKGLTATLVPMGGLARAITKRLAGALSWAGDMWRQWFGLPKGVVLHLADRPTALTLAVRSSSFALGARPAAFALDDRLTNLTLEGRPTALTLEG